MPSKHGVEIPAYRHHKGSGQAVVTLNGKDKYLGVWGTAGSKAEYRRLIAQWLLQAAPRADDGITVVELCAAFKKHARVYYQTPDGQPGKEYLNFRTLIQRLVESYAKLPAGQFGPNRLREFRESLIAKGQARSNINHAIERVRRIFKWGASHELIPASVPAALATVAGLKRGKTNARETEKVRPVPQEHVLAILPYVSRQVAAMLRLQLASAMRSGELCQVRGCDIDMSGPVWEFRPSTHKTMHHGHDRVVYLGPDAMAILEPWLRENPQEYLFQPREAEAERRARKSADRKTPASCGNRVGTNRVVAPKKSPRDAYDTASYLRAVKTGQAKLNKEREKQGLDPIPSWHPHQIRHTSLTEARRKHGIEVARILAGHTSIEMTQLYAEADRQAAIQAVLGVQ